MIWHPNGYGVHYLSGTKPHAIVCVEDKVTFAVGIVALRGETVAEVRVTKPNIGEAKEWAEVKARELGAVG